MDDWKVIGRIDVESGHIVISDPCDVREAMKAWDAMTNGESEWNPHGIPDAVFTPTGDGDGGYDVEARFIDGRVSEIRIVFIDLDVWRQ